MLKVQGKMAISGFGMNRRETSDQERVDAFRQDFVGQLASNCGKDDPDSERRKFNSNEIVGTAT